MIREPAVAGQFYPAAPGALKKEIESMVDKYADKEKAIGVLSPHAGYVYSGRVAGALFSRTEITDTVLILGPNHTGVGANFSLYKEGKWSTPLGEVDIDTALAGDISKSCSLIKKDISAHAYEHSLEVQVPFIQYFKKDFKIVPIVVGHAGMDACKDVAEAISQCIRKIEKGVLIIASSDMTHYEPHESAKKKDKLAIDAILGLDENLLLSVVEEYNISMCGYIPTLIMLIAAKLLGAKKSNLIKYQTSAEVSGDYSAVVGYAGIMVK